MALHAAVAARLGHLDLAVAEVSSSPETAAGDIKVAVRLARLAAERWLWSRDVGGDAARLLL